MTNEPKKPDFSNVNSAVQSTAADAPPKADFSNVQGGVTSTAPDAPSEKRTYTVVKGDTLSKIAKTFYGNANQWKTIFEANRDQLTNPDLIKPGQVLTIPDVAGKS